MEFNSSPLPKLRDSPKEEGLDSIKITSCHSVPKLREKCIGMKNLKSMQNTITSIAQFESIKEKETAFALDITDFRQTARRNWSVLPNGLWGVNLRFLYYICWWKFTWVSIAKRCVALKKRTENRKNERKKHKFIS